MRATTSATRRRYAAGVAAGLAVVWVGARVAPRAAAAETAAETRAQTWVTPGRGGGTRGPVGGRDAVTRPSRRRAPARGGGGRARAGDVGAARVVIPGEDGVVPRRGQGGEAEGGAAGGRGRFDGAADLVAEGRHPAASERDPRAEAPDRPRPPAGEGRQGVGAARAGGRGVEGLDRVGTGETPRGEVPGARGGKSQEGPGAVHEAAEDLQGPRQPGDPQDDRDEGGARRHRPMLRARAPAARPPGRSAGFLHFLVPAVARGPPTGGNRSSRDRPRTDTIPRRSRRSHVARPASLLSFLSASRGAALLLSTALVYVAPRCADDVKPAPPRPRSRA
jgi:hypothetical protein